METWLLPQEVVLKRCHESGPWRRLVAMAEQLQSLADLKWRPGCPYGLPGFRSLRRDGEWTELEMEFIEGQPFGGPHAEAAALARRICQLLGEVHRRGHWHGDLSPDNLLVAQECSPVLLDFGVQRGGFEESLLSLRYAAPERLGLLERAPGPASDVFSLGLLLAELWTGKPLLKGASASELMDQLMTGAYSWEGLPLQVATWLKGALVLEPEHRYRDGADMLQRWSHAIETGGAQHGPLVGRVPQLQSAELLWQRAQRGQACWMMVRGESGMGKTRFLEELTARWRAVTFYGRAAPSLAPPAYEPLRMALSSLRKSHLKQDLDEQSWWWLKQIFPGLEQVHPGRKLELSLEHSATRIAPESQRALLSLGRALGQPGTPVVLILDDLQWADEQMWDLLVSWSQQTEGDLVVCLGTRSASLQAQLRLDLLLDLPPLTRTEQVELLKHLGPEPSSHQWLEGMADWIQGNPFFLRQLSEARKGQMLPELLQGTAPPPLQKAALNGRRFARSQLDRETEQVYVQNRWIWIDGDHACFAHDRVRDWALQAIDYRQKAHWHAQLAETSHSPAERGLHLWAAGQRVESLPHLLRGGQEAMARREFSLARPLWEATCELETSGSSWLNLCDCLIALGHYHEALEKAKSGLRKASLAEIRIPLHQRELQLLLNLDRDDLALIKSKQLAQNPEMLIALLKHPELQQDLVKIFEQVILVCTEKSQPLLALRLAPVLLVAYFRGKSSHRYVPLATIYLISWLFGRPQQWLKLRLESAMLSEPDPFLAALVRGRIAATRTATPEQALAELLACEPLFQSMNDPFELSSVTIHIQWLSLQAGRIAETRQRARRNLTRALHEGDQVLLALSLAALAWTEEGRLPPGLRERLNNPPPLLRPIGQLHWSIALLCSQPGCALAVQGLRSFGSFDQIAGYAWLATGLRQQACRWSRLNRLARQQLLREALQLARRGERHCRPLPFFWARAVREIGLIQLCLGESEIGHRQLEQAEKETLRVGNLFELSHLYRDYGEAARLWGWPEAGRLQWQGAQLNQKIGLPQALESQPAARLQEMLDTTRAILSGARAEFDQDNPVSRALVERMAVRQKQREEQARRDAQLESETRRLRKFTDESRLGLCWLDALGQVSDQNRAYDSQRPADTVRQLLQDSASLAVQWPPHWQRLRALSELQQAEQARRRARWTDQIEVARRQGLEFDEPSALAQILPGQPELEQDLRQLSEVQCQACLGILREAVNNWRKHAPGSRLTVVHSLTETSFRLSIADDGPGPLPSNLPGFGLISMNWRARLVGGSLQRQGPPGHRLLLEIPLTAKSVQQDQ